MAFFILEWSLEARGARKFVWQGHATWADASIYVGGARMVELGAMCPSDPLNHLTLSTLAAGYLKDNFFRSVNSISFHFFPHIGIGEGKSLGLRC